MILLNNLFNTISRASMHRTEFEFYEVKCKLIEQTNKFLC